MTLGDRIVALREARGWSQNQLASKAKMNQATLQKYEANTRTPGLELAVKIAAALGVTLDALVSADGQPIFSPMPPASDVEAGSLQQQIRELRELVAKSNEATMKTVEGLRSEIAALRSRRAAR